MLLCLAGDLRCLLANCLVVTFGVAFQQLLDQIDAAAGTVEFVAKQVVGRAGGQAESAMHTGAQDLIGLFAYVRCLDRVRDCSLHDRLSANVRGIGVKRIARGMA